MRIIFVRHGQPDYALNCLTEIGRLQAAAAAERLQEEGIEAIYSSPYGRAMETAQYTADRLGISPIHVLDFMHEITWGSKEKKPLPENGHPWRCAAELVRRGFDVSRPDWAQHPVYRGNAVTEEPERVARALDAWLATLGYQREGLYYRCTHENAAPRIIALFSHGGSSTCALAHLMNQTFPYACLMTRTQFTGITVVRFSDLPQSLTMPRLDLVSDARHLRGLPDGLEKEEIEKPGVYKPFDQ